MATGTGSGVKYCLSLLSLGWKDFKSRRHGVDDSSRTDTPESLSNFVRGSTKKGLFETFNQYYQYENSIIVFNVS